VETRWSGNSAHCLAVERTQPPVVAELRSNRSRARQEIHACTGFVFACNSNRSIAASGPGIDIGKRSPAFPVAAVRWVAPRAFEQLWKTERNEVRIGQRDVRQRRGNRCSGTGPRRHSAAERGHPVRDGPE
jgi:hypothetical protein